MTRCAKKGCGNKIDIKQAGRSNVKFSLYLIQLQGYCSNKCIGAIANQYRGYEKRIIRFHKRTKPEIVQYY